MGRHWKCQAGVPASARAHVRRAVMLSADPDGVAIVEKADRSGWLAFVPEGRGAARLEQHAQAGRLIGLYRQRHGMSEEAVGTMIVDDIRAALGAL